jgi:hypothetical protein
VVALVAVSVFSSSPQAGSVIIVARIAAIIFIVFIFLVSSLFVGMFGAVLSRPFLFGS